MKYNVGDKVRIRKGAKLELAYCNYIGVTALLPGVDFSKKSRPGRQSRKRQTKYKQV